MSECLFLVYHNFSSTGLKEYPDLKGLRIDALREQLKYLLSRYEPLTLKMLAAAVVNPSKLPDKCFYATFDDGYRDQILLAVDELEAVGIKGGFFVCTKRLEEKKLITVDKQRFLLYAAGPLMVFMKDFCQTVRRLYPEIHDERFEPTEDNIREASDFYSEFPFYSNEERFYRKIRDVFLNEEQFRTVIDDIFPRYFEDEAAIVEKYFMNWDDLRSLLARKMEIGSHTHSHPLLSRLAYDAQSNDIKTSLELLRKRLGIHVKAVSYPYGAFNEDTMRALKDTGVVFAFMEDGLIHKGGLREPYRLSRLGPERLSELMTVPEGKGRNG